MGGSKSESLAIDQKAVARLKQPSEKNSFILFKSCLVAELNTANLMLVTYLTWEAVT